MSTGKMRRAQLVSPFGVGAMSVLVNGSSVITAGLDHWYETDERENLYLDEFTVPEWRLQERLKVRSLRLPPDYRRPVTGGQRNTKLTVPVLRFPRWCFCIYCKRLTRTTSSMTQLVRCEDPTHKETRRPVMSQVPFIIICEDGHLDDFPFDKWVHRSLHPSCPGPLRLLSQGGGTLAGQLVRCDECKLQRNLDRITSTTPDPDGGDRTFLSTQLAPGETYNCTGSRPWVADDGGGCPWPVRGALRAAGNVYFPKVESSIFLPRHQGTASAEVLDVLRSSDVEPKIQIVFELLGSVTVGRLRQTIPRELLSHFSDEQLQAGLEDLFGGGGEPAPSGSDSGETLTGTAAWRYPEYQLLRETPSHPDLTASDPGLHVSLISWLNRVRSVEVLRETRALRGFTRVRDTALPLSKGKEMLRRNPLPPHQDWLPACVVKGEGLYLELDPTSLSAWESRPAVQDRADKITTRYAASRHASSDHGLDLSPRLILLHTTAHLLINELVFTCGYSSASLRERLYVHAGDGRDMAGVLVYTAAGDSEGTMGGLVRMARPDNLGPVFRNAIDKARWCSADPVCMEAGDLGQGPESCNLAACHGCALLPETSCEQFNRFLDRGIVVGTFTDPTLGYFSGWDT